MQYYSQPPITYKTDPSKINAFIAYIWVVNTT